MYHWTAEVLKTIITIIDVVNICVIFNFQKSVIMIYRFNQHIFSLLQNVLNRTPLQIERYL